MWLQGDQMFLMWGAGTLSLQVPRHLFKWKSGEGSRHLQPAPPKKHNKVGMLINTSKLVAEFRYHNPDPLVCLLGHANDMGCLRGITGSGTGGYWVPNLCPCWRIMYWNGLKNPSTEELDKGCGASWGDGGILIPYKGYVEANLTIPDLPWYNEDVLFLVVLNQN